MHIATDGATLDVTDHGGDGPDLLLTHGLGLSQRSLGKLVTELLRDFRVITFDMRGHGASSPVPWTFADAVNDIVRVAEELQLTRPLVAGHSLGGMIAVRCAGELDTISGAVNLDGWGHGTASQYVGANQSEVARFLDDATSGVPSRGLGRVMTALMSRSASGGARIALARQVAEELRDVDVLEMHRAVRVPTLAFNATAPMPRLQAALMGPGTGRLLACYRLGLRRDLDAAMAAQPLLRVHEIAATHALISTHAGDVAEALRAWSGAAVPRAGT